MSRTRKFAVGVLSMILALFTGVVALGAAIPEEDDATEASAVYYFSDSEPILTEEEIRNDILNVACDELISDGLSIITDAQLRKLYENEEYAGVHDEEFYEDFFNDHGDGEEDENNGENEEKENSDAEALLNLLRELLCP